MTDYIDHPFSGGALGYVQGPSTGGVGGLIEGMIKTDNATGKTFRFARIGSEISATAAAVGDVCIKVGATGCLCSNDADLALDASAPQGLGFATQALVASANDGSATAWNYTWLQIYGRVETSVGTSPLGGTLAAIPQTGDSFVAGTPCFASTTDSTLRKVLIGTTATGAELGDRYMGYALAASTDSGSPHSVTVFADMRGAGGNSPT